MKNGFFTIDNQSMTSVVATLVTDYEFCLFGQKVDNLTFSLVTPLSAENNYIFAHCLLQGCG
ncbi:MAG: hypothetical protein Sw1PiTSA_28960 [Shewanella algae]|uniref:Uncharacterized protein n=1 Tax=Shewanella algae TaxID=38313 RepID=A0AAD1K661_9GAMM|nr:hypothetical protein TUM4442_05640 [Shewanella algae]BCV43553.1 hypothetical protein TUM17379_05710 [Shewanella algae]BCV52330.1 hypothetical protein TUM17383_05770 [Shewanella algae]BCV56629.1 hypothetical protein TUM17384_05740 [Shewanella algae]BCV62664.1 hypothetical protein TUM17386_23350 [Shewanella algae]